MKLSLKALSLSAFSRVEFKSHILAEKIAALSHMVKLIINRKPKTISWGLYALNLSLI